MKGDLTREEIERYGEMLDNQEYRNVIGITTDGGAYTITSGDLIMMTGRLGAIRYIKTLEETLENDIKSYIIKQDENITKTN